MNIMIFILQQYLITFGWAITGAVSMGVALSILVKIFSWVSPINDWEEIRNGNKAMAIVLGSVILGGAIVIGFTVMA